MKKKSLITGSLKLTWKDIWMISLMLVALVVFLMLEWHGRTRSYYSSEIYYFFSYYCFPIICFAALGYWLSKPGRVRAKKKSDESVLAKLKRWVSPIPFLVFAYIVLSHLTYIIPSLLVPFLPGEEAEEILTVKSINPYVRYCGGTRIVFESRGNKKFCIRGQQIKWLYRGDVVRLRGRRVLGGFDMESIEKI